MKQNAIIPIFIPHKGCPNDCVFCNQKKITARQKPFEISDVRGRIEEYLPTLLGRGLSTLEIAFFGGSFTGIPLEEQQAYLAVAKEYKDRGLVQRIRLSTRPDYIDDRILENLRIWGVDLIELGVQSLDPEVLRRSNRGHGPQIVYESAAKIREAGFELGIQLMIGLPGDTKEKSLYSVREAVGMKPAVARLYPTVILKETALYEDWKSGRFQPFSQEAMVDVTKEMYRILRDAGVNVIRVGLKSTDLISGKEGSAAVAETYHPAFRQLICAELAKEELERQLTALLAEGTGRPPEERERTAEQKPEAEQERETEQARSQVRERTAPGGGNSRRRVLFSSCGESFSDMIGNRGSNRAYFEEKYPELLFRFCRDDSLGQERYRAEWDQRTGRRPDR